MPLAGVRFQGLRDAGDPIELAKEYQRQGADEIVMLDISATSNHPTPTALHLFYCTLKRKRL